MPSTDVTEPKVSVHGIPQSQYEQQYSSQALQGGMPQGDITPTGGGGLLASMEQHKGVWAVVIGVATIIVIIVIYRLQQSQAGGAATDSSGNLLTTGSSGTGSSGTGVDLSGIESEYNQLISLQNQNNGTLASILSAIQGQTSGTGNTGGTGSNGVPNPNFSGTPYGEYGIPQGVNTSDLRNWTPIDSGSAADTEHWDTAAGVPIYSAPNSNASILRTSPWGQNITTYAAWTAQGPLEYSTGTTWSAVAGGGYVPTYSLVPDLNRYVGTNKNPIFGSSNVPTTPFK